MTFFLFKIFGAILNFLAPQKPKTPPPVPGKLTDIDFPRASEGGPVPRQYGTVKVKFANTIWDGDFLAKPIKQKQSTGLFSSKKVVVGYQYYIGMDLALCLGPGYQFKRIWAGNYELWNGCLDPTSNYNVIEVNLPNLFGGKKKNGGFIGEIALYGGAYDQDTDPYLQGAVKTDAGDDIVPAYVGVAHAVFRKCYMGNSTSINPIYFEGSMFPDSLGLGAMNILKMQNCDDMNPVGILHHIFTDDWGNLGIDPTKINEDQWKAAAQTVYNEGLGASLAITSAAQASDAIKELKALIAGEIYRDPATDMYELALIRNDYDHDTLPIIGPESIKSISNFQKTLWSETSNIVRVKFTDRTQKYKEDVTAQAQDFANIRFQKKPKPNEMDMQAIYDPVVANTVAWRELAQNNVPLYSMTLTLNRIAIDLAPSGVFKLAWPEYGIAAMIVRVRKQSLGTLEDGTVSLDVVQDLFGAADILMSAPVAPPATPVDNSPKPVAAYTFVELPKFFDLAANLNSPVDNQPIAIFASPPSPYSTSFDAHIVGNDNDPDDDPLVLDNATYANSAKLTVAIGHFDGFATGIMPTLTLGTVANSAAFHPASADQLAGGANVFMIGRELFSYEAFVVNNDGTVTLSNVHRALIDTTYEPHAVGDLAYFFEGQEQFIDGAIPIGVVTTFYLLDQVGQAQYDVASAARIAETPAGRIAMPYPPDDVQADGERSAATFVAAGATIHLGWAARSRLAGSVAGETDPAQAPEAGETYAIDVLTPEHGTLHIADGLTDSSYDLVVTDQMTHQCVAMITASNGGINSFTPAVYPFIIGDIIEVDDDPITVDEQDIEI